MHTLKFMEKEVMGLEERELYEKIQRKEML